MPYQSRIGGALYASTVPNMTIIGIPIIGISMWFD